MEGLIKTDINKDKAKSILNMVDSTLNMICDLDKKKYPTHVLKEYYEVIRELMSVVLLLEGYKTTGDRAHYYLIKNIFDNKIISQEEYLFVDELRIVRNRILYDGEFIDKNFLRRHIPLIKNIIKKLKVKINSTI
jgi:hypothetical protein